MSRQDLIALFAAVVPGVSIVAPIGLTAPSGPVNPCGQTACVTVDGLRFVTDGPFLLREPLVPVNCVGPFEQPSGWSVVLDGGNLTIIGWWNCSALQNVTAKGQEATGRNYSVTLSELPGPGDNSTWISPDRELGVQLFGLSPSGMAATALARVA